MKIRLTILFLALATFSFAQKKELKKIERAVQSGDITKAVDIFNSIDESNVEQEYLGQYNFYKAAVLIDVTGKNTATMENAMLAYDLMQKSREAGFDNGSYTSQVNEFINQRLMAIANQQVQESKTAEALIIVEKLADNEPDNLNMTYNVANLSYQISEFGKAKVAYQKLFDNEFTGSTITYKAVSKATNQEEAFPSKELRDISVSRGTHITPSEVASPSLVGEIVTNLVWLHKESGDMDKARSTFEEALQKFSNDESLLVRKAENYLILNMMEEYKAASESNDVKDPKVYQNLGLVAVQAKDYSNAINYYETALSLEPNDYNSLINISIAYIQKGNLEETSDDDQLALYRKSIDTYERAHALKPENKDIITTLIGLYKYFKMEDKLQKMENKL